MHIPMNAPTFGETEINAAIDVLRSSYITMGNRCLEFEQAFAEKLKVKNAIFVNSGSSANLLALFALANPTQEAKRRLMPGDEVIVPAVTWSTTIWPIVQAGAVPVLVDSDPETLQIKTEEVRAAITKKTKAIMPVHVLGNSAPIQELMQIAKENNLWLIEDTCEALGVQNQNQHCGTFGDIGTFSFFFSHHITTIEGGMVVTNNDELAELMRCLRAHGWTRHLKNRAEIEKKHSELDPRFLFVNAGFNLRPTEINAVFGLHQIKKLDEFNSVRRNISRSWNVAFQDLILRGEFTPMRNLPNTLDAWFGYPVICKDTNTRLKLQTHLEKHEIETRPIICGNMARQPALKMFPHRIYGNLKGADKIMDNGLFWGLHPTLNQEESNHVIATVKSFFN